ncbi:MAG: 4Fe-4S binding protein [Sedimentisphaerales bacterium]|nr:4Fe-4S binding protein [Sedimentisphaerales bacterium]
MKELVVISGKGGTGKTSITAAFASLAKSAVFADCDVDAADLHLILKPLIRKTTDFSGGKQAFIISEKCVGCGKCKALCKFGAINYSVQKGFAVDPISCEGCKVCVEFCPAHAIEFKDVINGQWFISDTRFGTLVHAKLGIAQENSGKLVSLIRKEARRIAQEQNKEMIISDGSPGIGCPVIASITGADLVVLVTEPTMSAQHDLERVIELIGHFKIPAVVCINKFDINEKKAKEIETNVNRSGIKAAAKIPYDTIVTKAQIAGQSVIEYSDNGTAENMKSLWQAVMNVLERKENN